MIRIVGAGPGSPAHMTQKGVSALMESEIVVSGGRLLEVLNLPAGVERIELPASGMAEAVVGVLEKLEKGSPGRRIALVVSGDPGFYSLAKKVIGRFGRDSVEVIPGISSLQILSARLGRSWVNVPTATLHGRFYPERSELAARLCASGEIVILLGGADVAVENMRWLSKDSLLGSAKAAVGWDLGLPEERLLEVPSLAELLHDPYKGRLALLWLAAPSSDA